MNGRERQRERERDIQTDRQSNRVGVYRRQYGVDDSWLNLSTNLSTVSRQKPGKIEILSEQLRIAYAIIFQPPCRPLDLIAYHIRLRGEWGKTPMRGKMPMGNISQVSYS